MRKASTGHCRAVVAGAVQAVVNAPDEGQKVPLVFLNGGHEPLPGQDRSEGSILTRGNLEGYKAESS